MPSTRRRFLSAAGVTAAAGLAGCSALGESPYSPGTDDATEWPTPGHDAGRSGFAPDAAAPRDGVTVRWRTDLPAGPTGPPVVAAGVALLPTRAGLVACDLADGTERWRVGTDDPWPTAPAVRDGTAYVGFRDRDGPPVRAIDVADGSERWTADARGDVYAPPVVDADDETVHAVYAGDDTGRVYQFDPDTGDRLHAVDVFGPVTCVAADLHLLVGTEGGEFYAFYDAGDRLQGLWRRKLGGKVTAAAARNADPFVATFGGPLYRLADGAHAGRSRWTADRGAIHLAATGRDVVGADGGGLGVYDARTGDRRWRVDGRFDAAPAVAGDLLVACGGVPGEDGRGVVAAYGMRGGVAAGVFGRARWTFETDSAVREGVAVADGAVFAATQGVDAPPRLYALDPA